ncbi:MAG TPA: hypothetical protein VHQ70_10970 [Syntrophomonadaceae bacterium]|nr:hypothetical protein [Syntrophomonadaceae bacterium]
MNSSDKAGPKNLQESLETMYSELNHLGYDLIDYSNSLGEVCSTEVDLWGKKNTRQAIAGVNQTLPAIEKIIEGFRLLGGLSIDLVSPYSEIDFEDITPKSEKSDNIIQRYRKLTGEMNSKVSDPQNTKELLERYRKLNRG